MRKKRSSLILLAILLLAALIVTSCSSKPQTLEEYAAQNSDIGETIDETAESSDVKVEIKGNDIIYSYDLSSMEGYTEEIAKSDITAESLEKSLDEGSENFTSICTNVESVTGLTGIRVIVTYTYKGEEIVSKTFTADDASKEEKE